MNPTPRAEQLPSVTPRERREAVEPFIPRRAERDGCGCPPQTVMCVHLDGRVLVLISHERSDGHTCSDYRDHGITDFEVLLKVDIVPCGRQGCEWPIIFTHDVDRFPDLPAALEAFEARAEELRQGVEA